MNKPKVHLMLIPKSQKYHKFVIACGRSKDLVMSVDKAKVTCRDCRVGRNFLTNKREET